MSTYNNTDTACRNTNYRRVTIQMALRRVNLLFMIVLVMSLVIQANLANNTVLAQEEISSSNLFPRHPDQ
jgi:hypothetical protein